MWPIILEKAFAKYHGNYGHTEGGLSMIGVQTLTGSPYTMYTNKDENESDLWNALVSADQAKDIITCDTHSTPSGSHDESDPVYGIAYNHAYTVVGVKQLSTGDKLVQVRNPWGVETYKGPWSDKDSRWTQALRDEVGRKSGDDGVWHIPIADFMKVMESAYVNKNTTGWSHGYFMKLNDTTTPNGTHDYCGSTCTRH